MISPRALRPLLKSTTLLTTSLLLRPHQARSMHITSLPMWVGSSNNYAYLVTCPSTHDTVLIDPANPPEVLPSLLEKMKSEINLTSILNTHHHWDHAGGNEKLLAALPEKVPVVGGKDCALVTSTPSDGSTFKIGKDIEVTALHTPCHTQDSICYYMVDSSTTPVQRAVFTGDTLFIGGCGKFFEGTPQEMQSALSKLASLPEDTLVYPGHEYTKSNVKFLLTVDDSEDVKSLQRFAENNKETQGKFSIGDEKRHNAFMRTDSKEMREVTGKSEPSEVMGRLREMKNSM
jgi:hydroxyacylglutathione hydrolase